ncbi:MAG: hypothetical protein LC808_23665 [Actinobacteria bacterium]|nr:hypothetical protein [Actinomycetota bacterium]
MGLVVVCGAGLAASLPEKQPRWLDKDQPDWDPAFLPIPRWAAIGVILVTLAVVASPWIDVVDRFWRNILERGEATVDDLRGRFEL